MQINEIHVDSFDGLHKSLSKYQNEAYWVFRGQQNAEWELIPKVGRPGFCTVDEGFTYFTWKRRAYEFIAFSEADEWDWITLAQHHGLATRLLDWSLNPLVAAYFAVEQGTDRDAAIYAYYSQSYADTSKKGPFDINGVLRYKPKGIASRVIRQDSVFTVHGPPSVGLGSAFGKGAPWITARNQLDKIILDSRCLADIRFQLSYYGYNRLTLFPDLDGLSSHVNWIVQNTTRWPDLDNQNEAG